MGTPLADEYLTALPPGLWPAGARDPALRYVPGDRAGLRHRAGHRDPGQPLNDDAAAVPHTPRDGEGYGLVEAPRGPLIHHYVIENGLIAKAEFIIPTVHNLLAIERALKVAANRYINSERINLELERAVGRVVRAFDPCIACATH